MIYRQLGDSGLKVSVIGLGGALSGASLSEDVAYECMTKAFSLGINFFDNAELYGNGESERVFGKVFKRAGWKRSEFVVSTKVFWGGSGVNQVGLSRKHIIEGVRASLDRMQLDYVDLILAHRPDPCTPMEEIVRAFNYLIDRGLALYWGTSEWSAQQITEAFAVARALHLIAPTLEQPEYHLLHRERVEKELFPILQSPYGMGLTVWRPLAGGVLTGKYLDPLKESARGHPERKETSSKAEKKVIEYWYENYLAGEKGQATMKRVAKLRDWLKFKQSEKELPSQVTLAQLALAWVLKNPTVSTAIIGATKPAQIEENVKALTLIDLLTPKYLSEIDAIVETKPAPQVDTRAMF